MENTITRTVWFDVFIPVNEETAVLKHIQTEIIDSNPTYISLN